VVKVKEIWSKGASAIPRITGKNLNELEKEWHDGIGQADASQIKYVTIGAKRWEQ
jgi:hypothetical protein